MNNYGTSTKEEQVKHCSTLHNIIERYRVWKTYYNKKPYWMLLVEYASGRTFAKHFDTKQQAIDYFFTHCLNNSSQKSAENGKD